jgi:predicted DNA-binding transcriptional regulator AlpA
VADVLDSLPSELQQHRVLTTKQSARFCSYSVVQWRALVRSGAAPAPIKLSARKHGWKAGSLIRWLNEKAAATGADDNPEPQGPKPEAKRAA